MLPREHEQYFNTPRRHVHSGKDNQIMTPTASCWITLSHALVNLMWHKEARMCSWADNQTVKFMKHSAQTHAAASSLIPMGPRSRAWKGSSPQPWLKGDKPKPWETRVFEAMKLCITVFEIQISTYRKGLYLKVKVWYHWSRFHHQYQ